MVERGNCSSFSGWKWEVCDFLRGKNICRKQNNRIFDGRSRKYMTILEAGFGFIFVVNEVS